MKVGIVSDCYHPHPSGITEYIFHTSVELRRLGHEVKIVTARYPGGRTAFDDNVIRLGRVVFIPLHGTRVTLTAGVDVPHKLKETLNGARFDILHIYGPLAPVLPLLSLILSNTVNIGNFHTQFHRAVAYSMVRPVLQRWFSKLQGKIAVSRAARDSFARYFPGDYRLIPAGVDVKRFNPEVPKISRLSVGGPTILFVGRLDPRKGLEHLVKAFPLVLRDHPSARLIVVGGGSPADHFLESLDPRVAKQVSFEGAVPPELLPSYYASCDVYCSPATGKESFGIVLLEAMASGKPVVASDIDGYREVVEHGVEGMLVPPEDPRALASAISKLLNNAELRATLSQNGLRKSKQYSWETVTRTIEDYYYEVKDRVQGRF